jgi:hypothetical protein
MINTRQMAIVVWSIVLLLALVPLLRRHPDLRQSLRQTLALLIGPKISVPIMLIIAWNAAAIWALQSIGFWNRLMLADTVTIVLANSVASLFRAASATYARPFFIKTAGVTIGVSAIAEVLVNTYTLSFWMEFILVGAALFIGLGSLCGLAAKEPAIQRPFDVLASILGLGLLSYTLLMAAMHFRSFASIDTLRGALLPFVIAAANFPILFVMCAWLAYGETFALLNSGEEPVRTPVRYKKWRLARTFGLNLARLQRFRSSPSYWKLVWSNEKDEVRELLRQ